MSNSDFSQLMLAPIVVSQRLPLLWLESCGLAPSGSRESERMVAEKMEAASDGMMGAYNEVCNTMVSVINAFMTGGSPLAAAMRGHQRITDAAVKPAAEHVRSNLERLAAA